MERTPTTDLLRMEYSVYPNFDHPDYKYDNPCSQDFGNCEGDCSECPNKDFFERAEAASWDATRTETALLLREKADYMERLAEKYGDKVEYQHRKE